MEQGVFGMPSLSLRYEGEWINGYHLKDGTVLTIGRSKSNDVVIENLGVSGHHAKIDSLDGRFLLTDLQSKNGTFVNDELITSCWLKHGDVITIAKHTLFFDVKASEDFASAPADLSEKTLIMDTDDYQAMLASSYSRGAAEDIKKEMVGVLSFISDSGGEFRLTKKLTNIGKGSFNDVVVKGFFVGKVSASISQRPAGYYLSYVAGFSKPKVNGKAVKQSVKLEDLDIIELGSTKMRFLEKPVYKK
jgi:pSer/pThr/pTyr-binding forkhead associated (FHA) protein